MEVLLAEARLCLPLNKRLPPDRRSFTTAQAVTTE